MVGVIALLSSLALLLGAAAQEAVPTERDLVRELEQGLRDPSGIERAAAIASFSAATRGLEDAGASRRVARAIAKAADDDDLEVRAAVVEALSWGRDPDVAIATLEELVEELIGDVEKRFTRPDDDSRSFVQRGRALLGRASEALGRHADDRVVEALADRLNALRPRGSGLGATFANQASLPICRALLSLGSYEAVETVVKRTRLYVGGNRVGGASALHQTLAEFSVGIGVAPPAFDAVRFDQDWHDWLERQEERLPEALGELDDPIGPPVYRRREPVDDGSAPRR